MTVSTNFEYGMFTPEGDAAVHAIVLASKTLSLSFGQVEDLLEKLADSNFDKFGEATDTAVREEVGYVLGFYS